jgi:uncharacterized membrane protein YdjX (TVP38/TMEM64 family)
MASRARDVATFIHSKVLIVDDELVRVGSANATHRSMGVDTECDVTVEAAGNPDVRIAIRRIRDRLIAEHLALPPDTATRLIDRLGSLRAVVDAQQDADHTLVRFEVPPADVPEPPALVQAAVDPDEPMASGLSFAHLVPPFDVTEGRALRHLWIVPAGAAAAAVVVVWIWSGSIAQTHFPDVQQALIAIRSTSASVVVGVSVVFAAGVMMAPLELLAIAAGLLLGWFPGGVVVLAGSLGVATVGYVAGRMIGPATLGRWMNRRTYRAVRQLGGRGVIGIAVLRLAAVGRASAIHLLLGAGRVPFGRYLSGTAIGLVPPIAVLSGFGALLGRALTQPSVSNTVMTVVGGLLLLVFSLARHREPAGLG